MFHFQFTISGTRFCNMSNALHLPAFGTLLLWGAGGRVGLYDPQTMLVEQGECAAAQAVSRVDMRGERLMRRGGFMRGINFNIDYDINTREMLKVWCLEGPNGLRTSDGLIHENL